MLEILVSSTVLILALAALRFLLRSKISPRLQYALWLLAALRLCLQPKIALKAVLTPANRRWTAAYLYQELCMEHAALRAGKGARG